MNQWYPEAAGPSPSTERLDPRFGFDDIEYSAETPPTSYSVFNPQNSTSDTNTPHDSILIGVGVFWGLLGVVVIALSLLGFLYFRRRRRALAGQEGAASRETTDSSGQQDISISHKPKHIPVVVVLPDDQVAFGWKIIVDETIKMSEEDEKEDISPKNTCESLESEENDTRGDNAV